MNLHTAVSRTRSNAQDPWRHVCVCSLVLLLIINIILSHHVSLGTDVVEVECGAAGRCA